ncbi:MAG: hypothetical protein MRY83_16815, partial [Flavobacteriales bacterium]|nr:hypothetical protein [Flavobacteriales bacterium]
MPKQWSTKDLEVLKPVTELRSGIGRFHFTDDYSVFHYSKMPDQIPQKGEALCQMAIYSLSLLEKSKIPTHFIRQVSERCIEIKLLRHLYPQKNEIRSNEKNYLVPLQVICRNYLPSNASLHRRLEEGKVKLSDVGLKKLPAVNEKLDKKIVEFTTKLEEIDRFISYEEAQDMAKLSNNDFDNLINMTLRVNDVISKHAEIRSLVHADSKIEFGFDDKRSLMIVDTVGTPDENRFLHQGINISKQVFRD